MNDFHDSHCHLSAIRLTPFRDEIALHLATRESKSVVVNGMNEDDWENVASLARKYPQVIPSFGYHPFYISQATSSWKDTLRSYLASHNACVGEIGIDSSYPAEMSIQEHFLREQLALAAEFEVPASIHCVDAWEKLLQVFRSSPLPSCGVMLHSYRGTVEFLSSLEGLPIYFSFSSTLEQLDVDAQRRLLRAIPRTRLLIETDSPFQKLGSEFPTDPGEKKLYHPEGIREVYSRVADHLGLQLSQLIEQIRTNFERLFTVDRVSKT